MFGFDELMVGNESSLDLDLDDTTILGDIDDEMNEDLSMSAADEAAYFLEAILGECDSPAEFASIVAENAIDWEAYGLIPSAAAAMEAVKRVQIENWKMVNFGRLWHRECIRLAKKNNDPNYKKYDKARKILKAARAPIFKRWEQKAKANVKAALRRSKTKATNVQSKGGQKTANKLTEAMKKAEAGHNTSQTKNTTNIRPKGSKPNSQPR